MIFGIGIDSVEIARFISWTQFSQKQLLRIFNQEELSYCFASPTKTAERLAARFAAREACFKALAAGLHNPPPFLALCKAITISHAPSGAPILAINRDFLTLKGFPIGEKKFKIHLSITHTQMIASAFIILERIE